MDLSPLFQPKSIAIIGASTEVGSVGNDITKNILFGGYTGDVFLVNPKTDTLFNKPCLPDIDKLPSVPDLAVIIVPAKIVPAVLRSAASKGIPAAIIISAGFRETGTEGARLEDEIISIAQESHIALLGPNCLGYLAPNISLNASFASEKLFPKKGSIAFFSQSGALSTALLDLGKGDLGFSLFASVGNKAVLKEADFLEWAAKDRSTRIVGLYSEHITDAVTFSSAVRKLRSLPEPKPVIILKSGTTDAGTKASSSHTGSLAGSDAAYEALFRGSGAIRAKSAQQLKNLLDIFSKNPPAKGTRVGIVTNAGGLGVLATDALVKNGLELASLSTETEARLAEFLPPAASKHNPVDVLGDAKSDRYAHAIDLVSMDPHVDILVVIVTPQSMTDAHGTASAIIRAKEHSKKPVLAIFSGRDALATGTELLDASNISHSPFAEESLEALSLFAQFYATPLSLSHNDFSLSGIDNRVARAILTKAIKERRTKLTESEGYAVFESYGLPILRSYEVRSAAESLAAAGMIGGPVVLKINSPDILHKSDVGGVVLDIDPEKAGDAYDDLIRAVSHNLPHATLDGATLVEMARPGGLELILGAKKEPGLGTLLMVGLGGIFVEVFKDAAFRFTPLDRNQAQSMLSELRAYPILQGARGQQGINTNALLEALGRLSKLIEDFPEISEIDINPLVAFPHGKDFRMLDARILLEQKS